MSNGGGAACFGGFAVFIGLIVIFVFKGISVGGEYGEGIPLPEWAKYVVGAIFIIIGFIFIIWGETFRVK